MPVNTGTSETLTEYRLFSIRQKIMNIFKNSIIIISQINNDEDLKFLGSKHPITVMGMILLALIGTIVGLVYLQELDPYDKTAFHGTKIEKENRNYTGKFKTTDIDFVAQVTEIRQDVKGMAAAVVGIKADLKAFFFGAKFGLENHFEFPFRFGDNSDDTQNPTPPGQEVAPTKAPEEKTGTVDPDEPSKQEGENEPSEPSSTEKTEKPGKPTKPKSPKPSKKDDCPDVKIVILKDTCDCGVIVIDTLIVNR